MLLLFVVVVVVVVKLGFSVINELLPIFLSYLILSYLVLSYLFLSYMLSYLVLSYLLLILSMHSFYCKRCATYSCTENYCVAEIKSKSVTDYQKKRLRTFAIPQLDWVPFNPRFVAGAQFRKGHEKNLEIKCRNYHVICKQYSPENQLVIYMCHNLICQIY